MNVESTQLINMMDDSRKRSYESGYNKAIDDVIKTVNSILPFDTCAGRFIDRDLLHKKLRDLRN